MTRTTIALLSATLVGLAAPLAQAADTYTIEPTHTYPSFEADHQGVSFWRGKFTKTSGTVVLDRAAKTGSMEIVIDTSSIDFGYEKMNTRAKAEDLFDVAKFPTATYKSKSITFKGDTPASVEGELTLHGVTRPVTLTLNKFRCIEHPMLKREVCGGDASATFSRGDFGINWGLPRLSPEVKMAIQVEAIKN